MSYFTYYNMSINQDLIEKWKYCNNFKLPEIFYFVINCLVFHFDDIRLFSLK